MVHSVNTLIYYYFLRFVLLSDYCVSFDIIVAARVNSPNDRVYSSASSKRRVATTHLVRELDHFSRIVQWRFDNGKDKKLFSVILAPKLTVRTTADVYLIKV